MKRSLFIMVFGLMAMSFAFPSHAQRLIPRQKGIEVMGSLPICKEAKLFTSRHFGAGISLTQYLKRENYVFLGMEYEQQTIPYRTYTVPLQDALLQVGYMHPFLSDRGKNIFGYLGISALGGYEEVNEAKQLLPDGATLLDRSRFVYGGSLHSSAECLLTDYLLLILRVQGRFLFGSDIHLFRPSVSMGIRFNL